MIAFYAIIGGAALMLLDDYTGRPIARRVERAVEAFALAPLSVADAHRRGVVVERPAARRPRRWGVKR